MLIKAPDHEKIITIERHIIGEQQSHPEATGVLTSILYDIALAGKVIASQTTRGGLAEILGRAGTTNVQGEEVMKLDELADRMIYRLNDHTGRLAVMASEEQEDIMHVPKGGVCVVDDAQLFFNSMRTDGDDYMKLRNLSNVIEKSDICLILNAHSTTLLNKTPTESMKTLIFKELGFFGAETERGYVKPYAEIADAFFQWIPVPKRVKYTVLFDLPYKCFGVAKTPLPKGWSKKVSTSCKIIDADFNELPKKEDKIKEEVDKIQMKNHLRISRNEQDYYYCERC